MTMQMKKFQEIQDKAVQHYLKHTNNRIARLDSEVEQKAEEAERLAGFYTENEPVLTEEQRRAIYLKIEQDLRTLLNRSRNIKYDVIALQETKGRTETIRRTDHNELPIIGAKVDRKNIGGVGFLFLFDSAPPIDSYKIISPRVAVLRLETKDQGTISIINGYAPTSAATDEEKEEFYKLLERTLFDRKLKIPIEKGVRQGDTISPKLFTPALQDAMKDLNWYDKGYLVDGKRISNFASPTILAEVEEMLNELNVAGMKIGLDMNMSKTQFMVNQWCDTGLKDLNWDDKGYLVDGKRISNLRFADDIGRSGGNAERAQCGRHEDWIGHEYV
ncbi:unnamed protein product [Heligmosomoides polygyrus]|uniref:Reverse transcriptase domain-containing protein n=1 Tax=Heligmosomoides polygyrus TaxID=6339 RepID=A0A183GVF7_HELPZ|nr:unnamed protein product [Heligmosomoides polygyrus]